MVSEQGPFREYHRAQGWRMLVRTAMLVVPLTLVLGLLSLIISAAPPMAPLPSVAFASGSQPGGDLAAEPSSAATAEVVEFVEPVENVDTAAPPASPTDPLDTGVTAASTPALPTTGPTMWSIAIDTRGYQDEIDECLWVRMDLGGHAPIVGAHNYCGGGIVLEMSLGDVVNLTGTDLEGQYVVSDARDAQAGAVAATAIDGMAGEVVLQSCYWGGVGIVRLVGLTPIPGA